MHDFFDFFINTNSFVKKNSKQRITSNNFPLIADCMHSSLISPIISETQHKELFNKLRAQLQYLVTKKGHYHFSLLFKQKHTKNKIKILGIKDETHFLMLVSCDFYVKPKSSKIKKKRSNKKNTHVRRN